MGFPGGPVARTSPSTAGGASSIPGQGTKIPHAVQHGKKKIFFLILKNLNRGIVVLLLPSHTSSFSSDITYPGEQIEMGTSLPISHREMA